MNGYMENNGYSSNGKTAEDDPRKSWNKKYGKRPLWQWILIYIVIGAVVYGAIYYFMFYNNVEYSSNSTNQKPVPIYKY